MGDMAVTLKGDPSLSKMQVSLKSMRKVIKDKGEGVLIELGRMEAGLYEGHEEVPNELKPVLAKFERVFFAPIELPPWRGKEHGITLALGTSLVSVRPYRYPYFQKNEIKKVSRRNACYWNYSTKFQPFLKSDFIGEEGRWMAILCQL